MVTNATITRKYLKINVNTTNIHKEMHLTMLNKDASKLHVGCAEAPAYSAGLRVSYFLAQ